MVIDDLDFTGVRPVPNKAQPILIVHSDTVLAFAIPFQGFEAIAGRNHEFVKGLDGVKLSELAERDAVNRRRRLRRTATQPKFFRSFG